MSARKLVLAAILAAASVPAGASVIVIGNSDARLCYESADSSLAPTVAEINRCNDALRTGNLTEYDTVATHVNRGILMMRRGALDNAIADFDRAIALNPNQPEAYLNKGAALIRRDNAGEAVQLFTVALEHNTQRPAVALFGRAIANEDLGNVRAAYEDYQRAAALAPDWDDPRVELTRFRVVER